MSDKKFPLPGDLVMVTIWTYTRHNTTYNVHFAGLVVADNEGDLFILTLNNRPSDDDNVDPRLVVFCRSQIVTAKKL